MAKNRYLEKIASPRVVDYAKKKGIWGYPPKPEEIKEGRKGKAPHRPLPAAKTSNGTD